MNSAEWNRGGSTYRGPRARQEGTLKIGRIEGRVPCTGSLVPVSLEKLWTRAREIESRLILAIDFLRPSGGVKRAARDLLREVAEFAAGVKVGLPLSLEVGWNGVARLVSEFTEVYWLADLKLADIPAVEARVVQRLAEMGFDGAIVHLFPMGLGEVVDSAAEAGLDVVGVAAMSHAGSRLFEENLEALISHAREVDIRGIVVGATRPELVWAVRRLHPLATILSPGVGVQGARPGDGLRAGADFEIVGRAITLAEDPRAAAKSVVEAQRGWVC